MSFMCLVACSWQVLLAGADSPHRHTGACNAYMLVRAFETLRPSYAACNPTGLPVAAGLRRRQAPQRDSAPALIRTKSTHAHTNTPTHQHKTQVSQWLLDSAAAKRLNVTSVHLVSSHTGEGE